MRSGGRNRTGFWTLPILLAGIALGLLALACFVDAPRRFYVAGLIASVGIDLDHIAVGPDRPGQLRGDRVPRAAGRCRRPELTMAVAVLTGLPLAGLHAVGVRLLRQRAEARRGRPGP